MSGFPRQALKILELGPTITVSERVNVIEIANDRASRRRESRPRKAAQEIGVTKSAVDIGHARLDESAKLEPMAVLGELDRSHLARPVVDILEQMTMDSLQMGQVEAARRHAFGRALSDELAFDNVQSVRVKNAKFISENRSVCIEIRIQSAHSAASGVTAARIWARRRSWGHASRSNISNIATSSSDNGLPSIS